MAEESKERGRREKGRKGGREGGREGGRTWQSPVAEPTNTTPLSR
jgi:hypothetical protein